MAWILGIIIFILLVAFSIYMLNKSSEAAKRANSGPWQDAPAQPASADPAAPKEPRVD